MPGTRPFAGVPLTGRDGLPLGALCVLAAEPGAFGTAHVETLRALAAGVVSVLELRRLDRLAGIPQDMGAHGRRLRRALDQDELVTWFQPVVELSTGEPVSLEALVRWEHPQRGTLGPTAFLPAVERTGLSMPLGRHVLHQALRTVADLGTTYGVAVNVSPLELREGLAASVLADLAAHQIAPSALALEVTERGVAGEVAVQELSLLREAGVRVVLDDFGAGRSSLQHVVDLPLTSLKLDGSLVGRLDEPRVATVVRSTIALARDLGLGVVAEGIETEQQRAALVDLGCLLGQGHLFSAAVAPADLPEVLSRLAPARPVVRPVSHAHSLLVEDERGALLDRAADLLEQALRAPGPVVLVATVAGRVALERALASRGVDCVQREGYAVLRTEELLADAGALLDLPAGATVVSDLTAVLWASGDVARAIAVEDALGRLPVSVVCCHEGWALAAHGTTQERRRLHEQHGVAAVAAAAEGLAAMPPEARDLVQRMRIAGASLHSIAAALSAEGFPSPSGVRWHWRQVERLLAG